MATKLVRAWEWYARQPKIVKAGFIVGGTLVVAVGGLFAAPMVGGAVSAAGFGVAGGMLSGAAASSAGLAALGGGSIAAGGLGMAGGTAVVASVAGLGGLASGAIASSKATDQGKRLADLGRKARDLFVDHDEIRFEEDGIVA